MQWGGRAGVSPIDKAPAIFFLKTSIWRDAPIVGATDAFARDARGASHSSAEFSRPLRPPPRAPGTRPIIGAAWRPIRHDPLKSFVLIAKGFQADGAKSVEPLKWPDRLPTLAAGRPALDRRQSLRLHAADEVRDGSARIPDRRGGCGLGAARLGQCPDTLRLERLAAARDTRGLCRVDGQEPRRGPAFPRRSAGTASSR